MGIVFAPCSLKNMAFYLVQKPQSFVYSFKAAIDIQEDTEIGRARAAEGKGEGREEGRGAEKKGEEEKKKMPTQEITKKMKKMKKLKKLKKMRGGPTPCSHSELLHTHILHTTTPLHYNT